MKQQFIYKNLGQESLYIIGLSNRIIEEYAADDLTLSLRQLYYQFVAHDLFPENRKWSMNKKGKWVRDPNGTKNAPPNYKWLGEKVNDGRNAGLIDWDAIEDRGRTPYLPSQWKSPAHIVRAAANQYQIDRWEGQENYAELMVEKDALSGILRPVCERYHVRFSANKGYSSSTAMYDAGQRFLEAYNKGKRLNLIHLGDHDPSGVDMTRDIQEKLNLYGEDIDLRVNRIALNMNQVRQWNPPPNPAKETDSRFHSYAAEHGDTSWELDAIEPRTLAELVEGEIESLLDLDQWQNMLDREQEQRDELTKFADAYERRAKKGRRKP